MQPGDGNLGCPPFRTLKAVPAMELKGLSPRAARILSACRPRRLWVSPRSSLPARLPMRLRVSPRPASSGGAGGMKLRGAPKLIPTGGTGWRGFELPRSPCLPTAPLLRLRVSPSPAAATGPMTIFHAYPNFASSHLASVADESSRATSLAPSGLALDAFSFSVLAPLPANRL